MRKTIIPLILMLITACSYDEDIDLLTLSVRLVYPENTIEPYEGARVELRAIGRDAIFTDSTNNQGVVTFTVIPGIYEASTSSKYIDSTGTTWWRYNFNGIRSMIVVTADSLNTVDIELKSSRKRVVQ